MRPSSPPHSPTPPAQASALIHRLCLHLETFHGERVTLVETHISWVVLVGTLAYKVKKPVCLPFLDFSTLAARRACCEAELRLNRRLAPTVYLDVVAIHGPAEAPSLAGEGEPLEYALRMRRFAPGALLSERWAAGDLQADHLLQLARRIAAFHQAAPAAAADSPFGTPQANAQAARQALQAIEALRPGLTGTLRAWLDTQAQALHPLWAQRRGEGHVREGHGDLHLGNTVLLDDGEATAFDCIEFDPALRWIDVLNDAGFLVMDLLAHQRTDLAFLFLNAYLDHTGDHEGLPLLRFYMVYRALVRTEVGLIRQAQGDEGDANPGPHDYAALARRLAAAGDPRLLITHGLPGSGKTFVSQRLLACAGAIRLRSDVERKRLAGLAPLEDSHAHGLDLYGSEAKARTYARLHALARTALTAGYPVIVDAAFLRRRERDEFAALANELGVPFTILDCTASPQTLRDRVRARAVSGSDASEADEAVLAQLQADDEALNEVERRHTLTVDTGQPLAVAALCTAWPSSRRT